MRNKSCKSRKSRKRKSCKKGGSRNLAFLKASKIVDSLLPITGGGDDADAKKKASDLAYMVIPGIIPSMKFATNPKTKLRNLLIVALTEYFVNHGLDFDELAKKLGTNAAKASNDAIDNIFGHITSLSASALNKLHTHLDTSTDTSASV